VPLVHDLRQAIARMAQVPGIEAPGALHVLLAEMIEAPRGAELIRRLGGDRAAVTRDLRGAGPDVPDGRPFERVLRAAIGYVVHGGRAEVGIDDVLAAAMLEREERCIAVLERAGISRAALLVLISHDLVESEDAPDASLVAPGGRYEVVFHDDDYTTRAFVATQLVEHFGLGKERAASLIAVAQRTGSVVVAERPSLNDAHACAREVRTAAREAGWPLLVTVKPAG
jgi:ATP-dependent Clp protease adaptor protein ClpS